MAAAMVAGVLFAAVALVAAAVGCLGAMLMHWRWSRYNAQHLRKK